MRSNLLESTDDIDQRAIEVWLMVEPISVRLSSTSHEIVRLPSRRDFSMRSSMAQEDSRQRLATPYPSVFGSTGLWKGFHVAEE